VLPEDLRSALADYRTRLEVRFGDRLRLVRLFGSWARGRARPDSDVDVAVVVDRLTRAERDDAIGDTCDVEVATGIVLTAFVVSAERFAELVAGERRIARDILADGVPP
jgi:predicted nucleotidyltransferase